MWFFVDFCVCLSGKFWDGLSSTVSHILNSYPMKTELSTSSTQWQNGITKAIIPLAESVSDSFPFQNK